MSPFQSLLKNLLPVITNIRYFFTKDFIKENYYKHFLYSLGIIFPIIHLLIEYCYLGTTPVGFILFIGYLIMYTLNFLREWYYGKKYKTKWSFKDIIFGGYGGIIGTILYLIIT